MIFKEGPELLQTYQCFKRVQAAKIDFVVAQEGDPTATLMLKDSPAPSVVVRAEFIVKHNPQHGGYYVRYPDGYESYSPAEAFEEGYEKCLGFITEKGFPQVHGTPSEVIFRIQSGPIMQHGRNGCQIDDVINWCKQRIEHWNTLNGCRENSLAITKLDEALHWLYHRRADRLRRGVEGTDQK